VQNLDKLYLKASWTYDQDFEPLESSVISIARVTSIGGALSQFPEFINNLIGLFASVPIVKQLITAISFPVTRIHEAAGQTSIAALAVLICLALLVVLVVVVRRRKARRQS
jgi:membrane protein DedA with SNARE-associated domain